MTLETFAFRLWQAPARSSRRSRHSELLVLCARMGFNP